MCIGYRVQTIARCWFRLDISDGGGGDGGGGERDHPDLEHKTKATRLSPMQYGKTHTLRINNPIYSHHTHMSLDFRSHKKLDLVKALTLVNVRVLNKDKKSELVEKCEAYVDKHGEVGALRLQKFLVDDGEIVAEDDEVATLAELDDDEDDDNDDDEAGETIIDVEFAENDNEDIDYNGPAPIDLKAIIADPVIEKWECLKDKVYEITDSIGITVLNQSDKLRDDLSLVVTLNFLEVVAEAVVFLYTFVSWVPLKDNALNCLCVKLYVPQLATLTWPSPQVSELFSKTALEAFAVWGVSGVVLPLLVSYYLNFTTRILTFDGLDLVGRVHDYDPFVFALSKAVIYYYISNNGKQDLFSGEGYINAFLNYILIAIGHYGKVTAVLRLVPVVVGVANVAVALYSQFEH